MKSCVFFLIVMMIYIPYPSTSFAQVKGELTLVELFRNKFRDQSIYTEGNCSSNVWRFIKSAREQGVPIDSAVVIYYFNEELKDLKLLLPRGTEDTYFYHVVLLLDGKIFDFDFGKEPKILPVEIYFKSQVLGVEAANKSLVLKGIPALEYLEEYSMSLFDEKNYYYYLLPEYRAYTEFSYQQFLEKYGKSILDKNL